MSRGQTQDAILGAELFWFGGMLGPPKIYDSGNSYSTAPNLRVSEDAAVHILEIDLEDESSGESNTEGRMIVVEVTGDDWTVTFDGAR